MNDRINNLQARTIELAKETDFATDIYRSQVKDFYSDLRETWERTVEEVVLHKTIERLVPDVKTMRLSGVTVSNDDYRTIFFAMKRVSERSGHDMAVGRDIPMASPSEMRKDVEELCTFLVRYRGRQKAIEVERKLLEEPTKAVLI